MGVTCTDTYIDYKKSIIQLQHNVKQISNNSIYRSDEIYKECSFAKFTDKKKKNKMGKCALNAPENKNISQNVMKEKLGIQDKCSWSKVYNSPTLAKRFDENLLMLNSTDNNVQKPIQYIPATDHLERVLVPKKTEGNELKTQIVETSLTSLKAPVNKNPALWTKLGLPRMLCPCCCGGGQDAAEPAYFSQSASAAAASFESIDLRTVSNIIFPSLNMNLDASLMSLFNFHKRVNPRKSPRVYVKILKIMLRNTYKNTISILKRKTLLK